MWLEVARFFCTVVLVSSCDGLEVNFTQVNVVFINDGNDFVIFYYPKRQTADRPFSVVLTKFWHEAKKY